ncbi:MAG TPA: tetratricopeptide repeat protein [Blastocatellia bacterium]|nr:tetratricopeptide repeat protein [Blastocatellia bacterium]
MNRIFSSSDSIFVAIYYAAIFLTPANLRGAARIIADCGLRIADCGLRIADWVCNTRRWAPQTALILGAAMFASASGFGQTTPTAQTESAIRNPQSAISEAVLPQDVIVLRREGNEALYNMDYATARAKFEEIKKRIPHHPAGDLYVATVIWLEHLNKSRRLQTSLYKNESSFYAGAEKAKEESEGDVVDQSVDRAFRDRMAQAKTKALSLVARNKNDADAQYFLGAYYGVMAGYEASTARKFYSAMRNGSRSVDAHEKTVKIDPNYHDAYLSLGMYDYIVGSLPFMYKALAAVVGARGNKQRGIARLKGVVEKETATADDARVLLLAIYQNEKRYEDALALLDQLSAKYQRSYLIKLERAYTLVSLKRSDDAYAAFEDLLKDPAATPASDLVHYQYAEALAQAQDYKRAAEHFLEVPKSKGADANLATLAILRTAQLYDLAGQRDDAVAQYKAVLARPNVYDTREQAEKGLKKPFREKEKEKGNAE